MNLIINFLKYYFYNFFKLRNFDVFKWSILLINQKINKVEEIPYIIKKNLRNKKNLIIPPKGSFWADPFIFKYKKKNYIFFEKYIYQNKRGEIAVGEIKNNSIINIKTIIKKKFHLSYPFVFTYKNKIFLIPETHKKKGIQIYISKIFPYKWKFYSSGFKNKTMIDPTILFQNKKIWLFVNEMKENYYSANKILKIYELDSLKLKKHKSHKLNPVINHEYGGRNAGRIFKIKNNYYRPAQINERYNYGKGLVVFQIKKLSNSQYHQKEIFKIYGDQLKGNYCGIHHLDILNNYLTTDVCLKKFK